VRPGLASVRTAQAIAAAKGTLGASQVATSLDTVAADLSSQITATAKLADSLAEISVHPLAAKARTLTDGLAVLQANLQQLSGSVSTLTGSTDAVQGALAKLDGGTASLGAGVHQLAAGVAGVSDSVAASRQRSDTLVRGLSGAQGELAGLTPAERGASARSGTGGASPSVIDSGYFVLAALDGRGGAGTGLNVDRGGQAARVLIVPRIAPSDPRAPALYRRLTAVAQRFARATGSDAAVGGSSALLLDYERQARTRFPLIVLVLALATTMLLAVLLRSLLVPVIGVALTLLTVGATIGLMGTFFAGRLDATTVIAVFAVMFALSIDYQVFIVGRIREEFDRCGDAQAAVVAGLRSTAHVVTGAAVSMLAVFTAFATTDVPSIRQFGVGLAIAVALDATVVRLVVLPAALKLAGRRAWGPLSPRRGAAPARTTRGRSVPPDARAAAATR
jgi:RND superfamily putative drug exporter